MQLVTNLKEKLKSKLEPEVIVIAVSEHEEGDDRNRDIESIAKVVHRMLILAAMRKEIDARTYASAMRSIVMMGEEDVEDLAYDTVYVLADLLDKRARALMDKYVDSEDIDEKAYFMNEFVFAIKEDFEGVSFDE